MITTVHEKINTAYLGSPDRWIRDTKDNLERNTCEDVCDVCVCAKGYVAVFVRQCFVNFYYQLRYLQLFHYNNYTTMKT